MELIGIAIWIISLVVLIAVIRTAIDGSRMSRRLDVLIDEVRMLRKELKAEKNDDKHIINKRV
ncbi:hypothetical protein [Paenibacillus sp. 1P07SE]|uniref:hypothetical protein n=1 Tax=Paenibacillus sp. 1P07SE TaxID=3132209 RepID=UPI0039A4F2EF